MRAIRNRKLVIATVVAATVLGGGVATAVASGGADPATPAAATSTVRTSATDTDDDAAVAKASKLGVGEAADAARAAVPGTVISAELDDDNADGNGNGNVTWDVDVLAKDGARHDVTIDAVGGKTLSDRVDRDDDGDDAAEAADAEAAKVSAEEAAAALKSVPGTVTSVDLDDDNGTLVWETEVQGKDGKRHDVTVDAADGEVLSGTVDREASDDDGVEGDDDGTDD